MNTQLKKILFIALGLGIVTLVFISTRSGIAHASKMDGAKFDDWSVKCDAASKDSPEICYLTQSLIATKDDKQEVLAIYNIGYFGPKKELKMVQILPLGVNIEAGTAIVAGQKLIAAGKYSTCTAAGCTAVADISAEDLKTISSSNEVSIAFMMNTGENKQVNLPLSIKGLEKGLAFLRK